MTTVRISHGPVKRAQNRRCALCRREFGDLVQPRGNLKRPGGRSWEHVWPRSRFPDLKHKGNIVLSHRACNDKRGDKLPNPDLLGQLARVNAEMGWELSIDQFKFDGSRPVPAGAVLLLDRPLHEAGGQCST